MVKAKESPVKSLLWQTRDLETDQDSVTRGKVAVVDCYVEVGFMVDLSRIDQHKYFEGVEEGNIDWCCTLRVKDGPLGPAMLWINDFERDRLLDRLGQVLAVGGIHFKGAFRLDRAKGAGTEDEVKFCAHRIQVHEFEPWAPS